MRLFAVPMRSFGHLEQVVVLHSMSVLYSDLYVYQWPKQLR